MNEDVVQKLNVSLTMHYKKLKPTKDRGIHLLRENECMNANAIVYFYKPEHIGSQFDDSNRMIQWVMSQIYTYNPAEEAVYGVITNDNVIYSHVAKL